jgi:uncharacterized protein YxjI
MDDYSFAHSRPQANPFEDPFYQAPFRAENVNKQDTMQQPVQYQQQSYDPNYQQQNVQYQEYYEESYPESYQESYQESEYPDYSYTTTTTTTVPNINVSFYQEPAQTFNIVRRNSFHGEVEQRVTKPREMESSFYTKGSHYRVDSFFDNIPVSTHAGEPIGDLDDFFKEFEQKTTIQKYDIPKREEPVQTSELILQANLERLRDMGFKDEDRNFHLLQAYDNDIDRVVKHLVDIERLRTNTVPNLKQKSPIPAFEKKTKTEPVKAHPSEQVFNIKVGSLKNLTYTVNITDEKDNLAYKAVLLLHSCIILKDKNNNTISRVVKDDLHIHPTYSISRNGRKLGTLKERFKLSTERKFNYHMFTGDVVKMNGSYGKDWIFRLNGTMIGTLVEKKPKTYELTTRSQLIPHIVTMTMIMLERRATSMRAVVLV